MATVELYYQNNEVKSLETLKENFDRSGLVGVRCIHQGENEVEEVALVFGLETRIFGFANDLEISSHYVQTDEQLSLHLSVPIRTETDLWEEGAIYILFREGVAFYFLSKTLEHRLAEYTRVLYTANSRYFQSAWEHVVLQIGLVADYYADLTELLGQSIKTLFLRTLNQRQYVEEDLDYITRLHFNNHLIKASIAQFRRLLVILGKSEWGDDRLRHHLRLERADMAVISDYIQNNFDQLDSLKDNLSNKIELEQNRIFRTLTVLTVCLSLPTLLAGIYGMNVKALPGSEHPYGYLVVLGLMLLCFFGALWFFRRRGWWIWRP